MTNEELYEQMRGDFDSGECAVISHDSTVVFCGKILGNFPEHNDQMAAIHEAMEQARYWPSIYSVNDHGNISLLDGEGNEVAAWV